MTNDISLKGFWPPGAKVVVDFWPRGEIAS